MVYDDLMTRNNTVSYYNINRSRPVTVQCIYTGAGAPVDRRRLICPNRTLNSVRIIVPFLRMASSPVTISHQLILYIYIWFNYTCHLGGTLQTRTYLMIWTHWNLLWFILDNNPKRSGFSHIYTWKVLLPPFIQYHHDPTLFSLCYKTIALTSVNWYNTRWLD